MFASKNYTKIKILRKTQQIFIKKIISVLIIKKKIYHFVQNEAIL